MLKFWPAVKILAMENIPILIGKPCDLSAQICAQLQGQPSGTRSEYGSPSLQSVVWFNLGLSKNQGYPKYPQLLYQVQCLNWGSWLSTWGILFSDKPIWTVFLRLLCLCLAGSMWLICFLQVATAADDGCALFFLCWFLGLWTANDCQIKRARNLYKRRWKTHVFHAGSPWGTLHMFFSLHWLVMKRKHCTSTRLMWMGLSRNGWQRPTRRLKSFFFPGVPNFSMLPSGKHTKSYWKLSFI